MSYLEWSTTAASNATADANIGWAEGQAPSTVNNSARAEMAALASYFEATGGALTTAGTGSAYTLTLSDAPTAYTTSLMFLVKFHAVSASTTATINVNALGAKTLVMWDGTALPSASYIPVNAYGLIKYDGTNMRVFLPSDAALLAAANTFTAASQEFKYTDAGATGPELQLFLDSSSPVGSDVLGRVSFRGNNTLAAEISYGYIQYTVNDATAASEDATCDVYTINAGTRTKRASIGQGLVVGNPTGGDQGANTINASTLYEAGTSLSTKYSPIAGSTSITTVGTVGTGTWQGTAVAVGFGGTGASTAAGARTNLGLGAVAVETYAEGSFTPTFTFGTPGDLSVAYGVRAGRYTRIGNRVWFDLTITVTPTYTTASGTAFFGGLPLTSANVTDLLYTASIGRINTMTHASGVLFYSAQIAGNATSVSLVGHKDGASGAPAGTTEFPSGTAVYVNIAGSYQV